MLQARRDLDLPQEPFRPQAHCDVRMEHLDRHRAVVSQVLRQIHSRHASPADLALDLVAAGYRGSESTEELYHAYRKLHARAPGGTGVLVIARGPSRYEGDRAISMLLELIATYFRRPNQVLGASMTATPIRRNACKT